MAGSTFTVKVLESRLSLAEEKIADMVRRARRLGLDPPVVVGRVEEREEIRSPHTDEVLGYKRWFHLTIWAPDVIGLHGWRLLAVVQHEAAGNITRRVPGTEETAIPAEFRESRATRCDHCHAVRQRTETFLVEGDKGTILQVGRQCLRDYLGVTPEAALYACGLQWELSHDSEGGEQGSCGSRIFVRLDWYLAAVAYLVRIDGWVSRREARERCLASTSDLAWIMVTPPNYKLSGGASIRDIEDRDRTRAAEALAWARSLPSDVRSEYLSNLRVACAQDHVVAPGLAASAITAYLRELERRERERSGSDQGREYLGKVGDKITASKLTKKDREKGITAHPPIEVTVTAVRPMSNDWGPSTLIKAADGQGHLFSWFASGQPTTIPGKRDIAPGMRLQLWGNVKAHREYQGQRETQLTRCVLRDDNAPEKAEE